MGKLFIGTIIVSVLVGVIMFFIPQNNQTKETASVFLSHDKTAIYFRKNGLNILVLKINDLPRESRLLGSCFGVPDEIPCVDTKGAVITHENSFFSEALLNPNKTKIAFKVLDGFGWIGVIDLHTKKVSELDTIITQNTHMFWIDDKHLQVKEEYNSRYFINILDVEEE